VNLSTRLRKPPSALEEEEEARLASASLAAGDPTGWFDRLYAAGARGQVPVPWRRRQPHPLLARWATEQELSGAAQRAVVVGCALGADAEYVASLGFDTTGFDISGTAIRLTRQRFPGSTVRYVVADLLSYPQAWLRAYDLVIEIITVQALPDPPRCQAIANISRLVGPGGTLLAIAAVHHDDTPDTPLPPWPLRRAEIEAFGADGLSPTRIEITAIPGQPDDHRWLAEFRRPTPGQPITQTL
jgi:SAM-dependent methyltransferase